MEDTLGICVIMSKLNVLQACSVIVYIACVCVYDIYVQF